VVSGEEYARLVAATTPQPGTAEPTAPPVPEVDDAPAPATPTDDAPAPAPVPPEPVAPPAEDTPPDAPETPAQAPDTTDNLPELPAQPETPPQGAPDLPPSETPQERQADRVAPTPVAPPPDDVAIADIDTESAAPDASEPADVVEEQVEETAQEETAAIRRGRDLLAANGAAQSARATTRARNSRRDDNCVERQCGAACGRYCC